MSYTKTHYLSVFVPCVLLGFVAALQLTGCSDQPAGIASDTAGTGGKAAQGGSGSVAGSHNDSKGGEAGDTGDTSQAGEAGEAAGGAESGHPEAGSTASGGSDQGAAGNAAGGAGGTLGGDEGGSSSTAGSGGQGGTLVEAVIPTVCPFHTDNSLDTTSTAGAGGAGGGGGGAGGGGGTGGAGYNVTLQVSPFVGSYLADATGRTLYTYGNDLPGDCHTPPVSNCVTDCLISWPILPATTRVLAPGLDDAAFGAIHRDDGTWQTTYYGWPLYYYKTDLLLGQVAGQGKAKTWHIVEKKLTGVFIMMKPGASKYLADSAGHTFYVSAADTVGTAVTDPVSDCSGSCLSTFEPFHETNFSVVSSLLNADFGSFVPPGKNRIQVAYKGKPLYRAITDVKSGDQTGTAVTGFTVALP